ncbi:hypothetical protein B0T16DRAFT_391211 [Cercophora newfieldiana]|uniref:Uncharacterized protein n=1 Tax=Cercophora newfieldiana TaxID=92897 RepID=A0AA39Y6H8_9PEZI|nr:hypothetical protein B0T16DRAFT_391211 [Cercophora newfieldiana]
MDDNKDVMGGKKNGASTKLAQSGAPLNHIIESQQLDGADGDHEHPDDLPISDNTSGSHDVKTAELAVDNAKDSRSALVISEMDFTSVKNRPPDTLTQKSKYDVFAPNLEDTPTNGFHPAITRAPHKRRRVGTLQPTSNADAASRRLLTEQDFPNYARHPTINFDEEVQPVMSSRRRMASPPRQPHTIVSPMHFPSAWMSVRPARRHRRDLFVPDSPSR